MTRTQEKRFYRNAVQASLETFYGKSKPEATKLVRDWWSRLSGTKAFESGIFLHAEPMNTAANIAGVSVIAITGMNRTRYHSILNASRDLVLLKATPSQTPSKKTKEKKSPEKYQVAYS